MRPWKVLASETKYLWKKIHVEILQHPLFATLGGWTQRYAEVMDEIMPRPGMTRSTPLAKRQDHPQVKTRVKTRYWWKILEKRRNYLAWQHFTSDAQGSTDGSKKPGSLEWRLGMRAVHSYINSHPRSPTIYVVEPPENIPRVRAGKFFLTKTGDEIDVRKFLADQRLYVFTQREEQQPFKPRKCWWRNLFKGRSFDSSDWKELE